LTAAQVVPHAPQLFVVFRSPHPESKGASVCSGPSLAVAVSVDDESCGLLLSGSPPELLPEPFPLSESLPPLLVLVEPLSSPLEVTPLLEEDPALPASSVFELPLSLGSSVVSRPEHAARTARAAPKAERRT
jgi:hypothetical protein